MGVKRRSVSKADVRTSENVEHSILSSSLQVAPMHVPLILHPGGPLPLPHWASAGLCEPQCVAQWWWSPPGQGDKMADSFRGSPTHLGTLSFGSSALGEARRQAWVLTATS